MKDRINVTKSSMPSLEEYVEVIRPLWDTRWLSNRGAVSLEFEDRLKEYLDTPNVWLFANGHVALEVTIQAFGFPIGAEVITTPYTHCSTTHSIVRNGLTPVLVDVEPEHYTINPALIEDAITDKTCAIVATHVYGFLCDVDAIERIAKKHSLKVFYDAAHAFGVRKGGMSAANIGDAAMFSTHATKVFHTIEGGIVCWNDDNLFPSLPHLVNFGFTGPEDVDYVGTNARMNEFEAAMGVCNLKHIDQDIARRRVIGERYYERLSGVAGLRLLEIPDDLEWNYAYFPLFSKARDEIKAALEVENIFARRYFCPSVDEMGCYKDEPWTQCELPVSHEAAATSLCLPMSSEMTIVDADRICDVVINTERVCC